ncbi:MAG: hypothetical protein KKA52_05470, partial [Candidatus Omnitrophica bacterium]|nr:hypothetical protein [Candidatus Omnitrophota bacterium]
TPLILLTLTCPAFSQARTANMEQEQALNIAHQVAGRKSTIPQASVGDVSVDINALIDQGYTYWGNLEFDKAKETFEHALKLQPNDPTILNLIYEVEQAKLKFQKRLVEIEQSIVQEKRILETEQAWVTEQKDGTAKRNPLKMPTLNRLREIASKKIVTMDFNSAQLSKIVEYLTETSGINIIMDEGAVASTGAITIHLKNVTVLKALDLMLRTKGLDYRFEDDFIWISSRENLNSENIVTRIYHLSQGLATFTTFTTFDTVTVNRLRGDDYVVVGKDSKKKDKDEEVSMGIKGVDTYEGVKVGGATGIAGKLTKTIKDVLEEIAEWPAGSTIFLDNRTSTLIVRNTPTNLALIEQALEVLDVNPPQVMIEARFVEIGADDLYSLGLKISGELSATPASSVHTWPFNKDQNTKYTSAFPTPASTDFTFGRLDASQFQAVLSAIEQNGNTNTLSSPKITTISGQEAVIKVVKEYRYPTKYEIQTFETVVNNATQTRYVSVPSDFKTRDIGIMLKVTPNVGTDGKTINLTLVPEVSEFDITADMYNYGTAENPYLQPFFSVRNCTASIVVNNSDTVVMGGLIKETVQKTTDQVPVLGSIPVLGRLFSRKYDKKVKRNLLIFVTAKMIAPTGQSVEN